MIFNELLEHMHTGLGWYGIVEHLLKLYPDQGKNADGFLSAVAELLVLEPGDANGFSLHVVIEEADPNIEDDEPRPHVYGQNGATNRDLMEQDGFPIGVSPDNEEFYNSPSNWAMELSPWEEILAMEVVTDLPLPDALAHILWEITFFGFSNGDVKAQGASLEAETERIKTKLKEEKNGNNS